MLPRRHDARQPIGAGDEHCEAAGGGRGPDFQELLWVLQPAACQSLTIFGFQIRHQNGARQAFGALRYGWACEQSRQGG